jgi:hypothetical protein
LPASNNQCFEFLRFGVSKQARLRSNAVCESLSESLCNRA